MLVSHEAKSAAESSGAAWLAFKSLIADMRDAPTRQKAEERREAIVEKDHREFPELCRCLLDDAEASLNHLAVPQTPSTVCADL